MHEDTTVTFKDPTLLFLMWPTGGLISCLYVQFMASLTGVIIFIAKEPPLLMKIWVNLAEMFTDEELFQSFVFSYYV